MPQKRKPQSSHHPRPSKKLRSDVFASSDDPLPPRVISQIHADLTQSLKRHTTHIFRALKKARGFETQKLVRRVKVARSESDDALLQKLEAELAAVKALGAEELQRLADAHLKRTLSKTKSLVRLETWPAELESVFPDGEADAAERNVRARIFGVHHVREAVAVAREEVREIMGLERTEDAPARGGRKQETWEVAESEESGSDSAPNSAIEDGEEFRGFSDGPADAEQDRDSESNSDSGEDDEDPWDMLDRDDVFAEFDDRIGGSDSSDSGSIPSEDSEPDNEPSRTGDEWSGSENEPPMSSGAETEEATGQEPKPQPRTRPKPEKKKQKTPSLSPPPPPRQKASSAPVGTSQFLPTLMSGYVSGSDSDPDASYYKSRGKKGPPEKAERKNRMGQQARRALWEKKYGRRANHLKEEDRKERRAGKGQGRAKDYGRGRWEAMGTGGLSRDERRIPEKKKADEGPLHPSWEAAKRAKEKQAKMAEALKKPQGKKIMFD